jgi:catechol 2,3-dioxygenase-like lactoylglutathione lyase family enzyme
MPVQACTHVGITVTDLEVSRRFFADGLGFEPSMTSSGSDHKITATDEYGRLVAKLLEFDDFRADVEFLKRDGMTIELVQYAVPSPIREPRRSPRVCGLTHMCFYVDDADETAARLVELGGTILEHTDTYVEFAQGNKVRLLFLLDPDGGVKVELVQPLG